MTTSPQVRPRKRTLMASLKPNQSCLIVGGLKGLCGSLAIWLAKSGVEHLTVMCRSACVDQRSLGIIRNVQALGCHVRPFQGDVSSIDDVRQCIKGAKVPIGGIIHGAMLLRVSIELSVMLAWYTNACMSIGSYF